MTLFTSSPDILSTVNYTGKNLKIVAVPTRSGGRARAFDFFAKERQALTAHIHQEAPDVLHAHWTYEFGLAARQSGVPALVTVHDWAPSVAKRNKHPYWYFRWAMQIRCLLYPGRLSAPSSYIAKRVTRYTRKACLIIPNGIDVDSFIPRAHPKASGVRRIGMLNAGLSPLKNVPLALEAWARVKDSHPSAVLIAAGPGFELGGEAHQWAIQNRLDDRVEFAGPVAADTVPSWMASLDVFLHPSLEESFGMVLLEAMAAGVPVIAGEDSGAVPVITGGNALLTDVRSAFKVAEALNSLMNEAELRRSLSLAGLSWSKQFSVTETARLFLRELAAL